MTAMFRTILVGVDFFYKYTGCSQQISWNGRAWRNHGSSVSGESI